MTKIVIADDQEIFREGLKQVIGRTADMIVADEAGTGQELLQKVQENDFDLVILDISMPDRNGLDILIDLKKIRPRLSVLVLSVKLEKQYALRAYKSGASGYLSKGNTTCELIDALKNIALGKIYISEDLAQSVFSNIGEPSKSEVQQSLSNREYQVLCMIGSGKPVGKIATELSLSAKTISTFRSHILRKLRMRNNSELTRFAIVHGLV